MKEARYKRLLFSWQCADKKNSITSFLSPHFCPFFANLVYNNVIAKLQLQTLWSQTDLGWDPFPLYHLHVSWTSEFSLNSHHHTQWKACQRGKQNHTSCIRLHQSLLLAHPRAVLPSSLVTDTYTGRHCNVPSEKRHLQTSLTDTGRPWGWRRSYWGMFQGKTRKRSWLQVPLPTSFPSSSCLQGRSDGWSSNSHLLTVRWPWI